MEIFLSFGFGSLSEEEKSKALISWCIPRFYSTDAPAQWGWNWGDFFCCSRYFILKAKKHELDGCEFANFIFIYIQNPIGNSISCTLRFISITLLLYLHERANFYFGLFRERKPSGFLPPALFLFTLLLNAQRCSQTEFYDAFQLAHSCSVLKHLKDIFSSFHWSPIHETAQMIAVPPIFFAQQRWQLRGFPKILGETHNTQGFVKFVWKTERPLYFGILCEALSWVSSLLGNYIV